MRCVFCEKNTCNKSAYGKAYHEDSCNTTSRFQQPTMMKATGMKKALKHKCFKASCGGDKRDRTADLLNAIGSRESPCSENAYF
jgi:hypothetical protein